MRPTHWEPLETSLVVEDDTATFRVSRIVHGPSVTYGAHWRAKHRETQEWQRAIGIALFEACGARSPYARHIALNLLGGRHARRAPKQRYTVLIRREVPSRRRFIRDDENLRFTTKPINDALKRLGLIYDDRREWLTQPDVVQARSADRRCWTEIRISPWWMGPLGPGLLDEDGHWRAQMDDARARDAGGQP